MNSELPLPYPAGYSKGGWKVRVPFHLHVLVETVTICEAIHVNQLCPNQMAY